MSFMFLFGFLGSLNSDFGLCFILVTLSLCPVLSIFTIVHLSFVRWWRRGSCRLCRTGVLSMWRSTQLGCPCHVITPRVSANGLHPQRELYGGAPSEFDRLDSKIFSCDCVKKKKKRLAALQVSLVFDLGASACCGELVFMERYKEVLVELGRVEQKMESQSMSSSSSSSEGLGSSAVSGTGRARLGSSGLSTLQAIGSAAAAGSTLCSSFFLPVTVSLFIIIFIIRVCLTVHMSDLLCVSLQVWLSTPSQTSPTVSSAHLLTRCPHWRKATGWAAAPLTLLVFFTLCWRSSAQQLWLPSTWPAATVSFGRRPDSSWTQRSAGSTAAWRLEVWSLSFRLLFWKAAYDVMDL